MTVVTSVVFVAENPLDAKTYQHILREQGNRYRVPYEVSAVDPGGPNVPHGLVFHNGLDYAGSMLYAALLDQKWKSACVLWWYPEHQEEPSVHVWTTGGWRIR